MKKLTRTKLPLPVISMERKRKRGRLAWSALFVYKDPDASFVTNHFCLGKKVVMGHGATKLLRANVARSKPFI